MEASSHNIAFAQNTDAVLANAEASAAPAATPAQNAADDSLQRPFVDLPAWIWRAFFASWMALLAAFIIIFGVSSETRFVLGVVCVFAAAFLGVPLTLLRLTRRGTTQNRRAVVSILTGQCKASEAALQIVLLPLVLCAGLIAIGLAIPR
jgi:hypothetical protein